MGAIRRVSELTMTGGKAAAMLNCARLVADEKLDSILGQWDVNTATGEAAASKFTKMPAGKLLVAAGNLQFLRKAKAVKHKGSTARLVKNMICMTTKKIGQKSATQCCVGKSLECPGPESMAKCGADDKQAKACSEKKSASKDKKVCKCLKKAIAKCKARFVKNLKLW